MRVVCILLQLYWFVLLARILLSYFPRPRSGLGHTVADLVYDLTEPVLKLVRGLLPPIRMGAMGLDLSPVLVFVAIGVLQSALGCGFGL